MGAWPGPPPTTPLTPTGQPDPAGGDVLRRPIAGASCWCGTARSWVPLAQGPAAAITSATSTISRPAGQTKSFRSGTIDLAGHSFAFNQTTTEGLHAHVNGVRVTPYR